MRRQRRLEPGINLTPMLDMIFNLIFFFILATQIRTETLEIMVNLPEAASATERAEDAEQPHVITVDADGGVYFKDRAVTREELILELNYLSRQGAVDVVVRGDSSAEYGRIVEVWDWCKESGVRSAIMDVERRADDRVP